MIDPGTSSPLIRANNTSAAHWPMRFLSNLTVVNGGFVKGEKDWSPKPTTARSSGILMPCERASARNPVGDSVGTADDCSALNPSVSKCLKPSRPWPKLVGVSTSKTKDFSIPCLCKVSRKLLRLSWARLSNAQMLANSLIPRCSRKSAVVLPTASWKSRRSDPGGWSSCPRFLRQGYWQPGVGGGRLGVVDTDKENSIRFTTENGADQRFFLFFLVVGFPE